MAGANRVLVGITGCIAAYKACEIVRGLQKAGVDVEVVMTESATKFVGPTTYEALTHKPVRFNMFGDPDEPIPHIALAERCDLFLIAPCTANVIAKLACGIADDLLTSTALAASDRLAVAPAMNVHMYEAPSTQANLETLAQRGVRVIEPASGYQACGEIGKGRLAEPDEIVASVLSMLEALSTDSVEQDLLGKHVLVTAGPTRERIDPVRYITNDSSGKMGYAIAKAAQRRGAQVTLVSGPVGLQAPNGVDVEHVESAEDMFAAASKAFPNSDISVFAAAVADMRPATTYSSKLKKNADGTALASIELVENKDILATLAAQKAPGQYVVGFAAETNNVLDHAREKLARKKADMIVANEVGGGKAFGRDEMDASIVTSDNTAVYEMISKFELANKILDEACANIS